MRTEVISPSAAADHRVEPEQRAGRHDDAAAFGLGEFDQIRARQQRAAAQHDDRFAGFQHRPADILDDARPARIRPRCRHAPETRSAATIGQAMPSRVEEGLRLGAVAGGGAGQRQPGHAGIQFAGQHAADGSKPCDSDANIRHFGWCSPLSGRCLRVRQHAHKVRLDPGRYRWARLLQSSGRISCSGSCSTRLCRSCSVRGLLVSGGTASAQDFPNRPMTMVIPFAAGGPTDVLGRVRGAADERNPRPAGGGRECRRRRRPDRLASASTEAKPDGYTFVLGTVGTHAQSQTLSKKPLYNAATDFTPVALIAEVPIALIARKDFPAEQPEGLHRLFEGQCRQDDSSARPARARRPISAASSPTW